MTKARQAVLDILMCAEEPLSAAAVQSASGNTFDPATIYRTLHYLEQKGRAESFVLHCREHGTERYYTAAGEGETHHHWFHCEHCHRFVDLGSCGICGILGEYEKSRNIEIRSHIMYLTGICSACKQEYLQNR